MRKICLSETDCVLFDEEMIPMDYDYLAKHKDTFCRMWTEQGKKFWKRYVAVFRSYIMRYSLLGDLTCDVSQLQPTFETAFVVITTHFIEGRVNQAKSFLNQVAELGRNRFRLASLDSKSVIKDPFYTKETRDIFREFFGPASEKSSYIKVYLLTPIYMKFGGSIVRCLTKWMEAEEIDPEDDSYYQPPTPLEVNFPVCTKHAPPPTPLASDNVLCAFHYDDCNKKFNDQFLKGVPTSPINLSFWEKKDPRFCEPDNPLWNPSADSGSDWRDGLTLEQFREFYSWCSSNSAIVKPQDQCQDCKARRKARKKYKKKKKKQASTLTDNLADVGFEDLSLMEDWGESEGKPKRAGVKKAHGRECHDCGKAFSSDEEEPYEVLFKRRPQLNSQTNTDGKGTRSCTHSTTTTTTSDEPEYQGKQLLFEKLDKLLLESQIGWMCSRRPDCQCPKCVIHPPSGFDLLHDPDWPGSSECSSGLPQAHVAGCPASLQKSTVVQEKRKNLFGKKAAVVKSRASLKVHVTREVSVIGLVEVQARSDPEQRTTEKMVKLIQIDPQSPQDANKFADSYVLGKEKIQTLTPKYLSQFVRGLPSLSCAESRTWCLVEVDYRKTETACKKPTWFVLRVAHAACLNVMKAFMIKLLQYIVKRKRRPSAGWIMSEHDIILVLESLGADIFQLLGVTIIVNTGATAVQVMTQDEFLTFNVRPENAQEPGPNDASIICISTESKRGDINSKIIAAVPGTPGEEETGASQTKKKKKIKTKDGEHTVSRAEINTILVDATAVDDKKARDGKDGTTGVDKRQKTGSSGTATAVPQHSGNKQAAVTLKEKGHTTEKEVRKKEDKKGTVEEEKAQTVKEKKTGEQGSQQKSGKVTTAATDNNLSKDSSQTAAGDTSLATKPEPCRLETGAGDAGKKSSVQTRSFSVCSNCGITEPVLRRFKKCARCKEQKVTNARYYCGVECQLTHWKSKHRQEHAEGTL